MNTAFKLSLAGIIALALSACGGQDSAAKPSAASGAAATSAAPEKAEIRFGTTPGDFGDMVRDQIQPLLEKKGYAFEEIVLGRDASITSVRAITGKATAPQVFIGGQYIGGSEDLEAYFSKK